MSWIYSILAVAAFYVVALVVVKYLWEHPGQVFYIVVALLLAGIIWIVHDTLVEAFNHPHAFTIIVQH